MRIFITGYKGRSLILETKKRIGALAVQDGVAEGRKMLPEPATAQ